MAAALDKDTLGEKRQFHLSMFHAYKQPKLKQASDNVTNA